MTRALTVTTEAPSVHELNKSLPPHATDFPFSKPDSTVTDYKWALVQYILVVPDASSMAVH